MPITITTNQFKFKDPTTGQYRAISAVADESLEERLEAIESAGNTAVSAVTTAQATAVSAIDSKKAEAVASVADAAESAAEAAATLESYAHVDGTYEGMTVGNAEQLVSKVGVIDKVPYTYRTSGGELDIGDREIVERIVGGTIAWNQGIDPTKYSATVTGTNVDITSNADGSLTMVLAANIEGPVDMLLTPNSSAYYVKLPYQHIYLIADANNLPSGFAYLNGYNNRALGVNAIISQSVAQGVILLGIKLTNVAAGTYTLKPCIFDLTQTFGSTIADWLYSLEQTTAGAGVAWFKKLFPKDYYAYNAGELMSVQAAAHNLVGFNQWDEEWEVGGITKGVPIPSSNQMRSKNFCHILPDTTYYATCGKTDGGNQNRYYLDVVLYDDNLNFISNIWTNNLTFTTPPNAKYFKIGTNSATVVYGTTYNHDICINFAWDGERDGEYQPYELHSYPLDDSLVLRGILKLDASNSLYYDGDIYESDGAVQRRYGIVDLGTLDWTAAATDTTGYSCFSAMPPAPALSTPTDTLSNVMCIKYNAVIGNDLYLRHDGISLTTTGRIMVYDSAYAEGTAAAFKTAMSGVYLVYELATPTTEEAEPYRNPQIVDDWGTEEYVDAGTRDVAIPVGHETFYQQNLRAKLEAAPNSPVSNGDYIMRQTNGANAYVPLVIPQELPTMPTSDGTYSLQVTISGGTPTLAWVQNQ